MPRTTTAPEPKILHTTARTQQLLTAMRLGVMINNLDMFTVQDVADAMTCVQENLGADDIGLERYIRESAQGTPWRQQLLSAADDEELGTLPDGEMRICSGDFMNLYAYPALVYGLALGLWIAEGEMAGGVR